MEEQARAAAILKRARDLLLERLTERVVEDQDAILEDALGMSYTSEIDHIYEQVGIKLAHVNSMLSQMPHTETKNSEAASTDEAVSIHVGNAESSEDGHQEIAILDESAAASATWTVSPPEGEYSAEVSPPLNFHALAIHTQVNDLEAAAHALQKYFGLDEKRAWTCAQYFQNRFSETPEILQEAMEIRNALESQRYPHVLRLLSKCFDLRGPEALAVLKSLRRHLQFD